MQRYDDESSGDDMRVLTVYTPVYYALGLGEILHCAAFSSLCWNICRNPNGPGLPEWKPFDYNTLHPYINLQSGNINLRTNYRKSYTDFWNRELPRLLHRICSDKSCDMPVVG
jgi:hypothetical protein